MPSQNQDSLLLSEDLALSETAPGSGEQCIIYTPDLARGTSTPSANTESILVAEDLAQTVAARVNLGELNGDTAVYIGDRVKLNIEASNDSGSQVQYDLTFTENGSDIDSQSKTIGEDDTAVFSTTVQKSNPGCFVYQANDSNELEVCWMLIRPGNLRAFPRTVYTGLSDTTSELKLDVEVPSSESQDYGVQVEFLEDGALLDSQTATISPGNTNTFSTLTDGYTTPQEHTYVARITNTDTGRVADTNSVTVAWDDDEYAVMRLSDLTASDRLMYIGDSTTLSTTAVNQSDSVSVNYELEFFEGDTVIGSETATINGRSQYEYTTSVSRSTAGDFIFQAADAKKINSTNELTCTWMNVRPGTFTVSENSLYLSDSDTTTTLSIPVENPGTSDVAVEVIFLENGSPISTEEVIIGAGNTYTYTTDVTKSSEQTNTYRARVIETGTGIDGLSNGENVSWTERENEFGNLILGGYVTNNGDSLDATFEPGGDPADNVRIFDPLSTKDGVGEFSWEDTELDGGDDFTDCFIKFDHTNWFDAGVIEITITHGDATKGHTWEVESYDIGSHSGTSGDADYQVEFRGLFWADNTVTDLSGNVLGSW